MKSIRGGKTVGVFGGSFDPPHVGHALLPALLRSRGQVDHVVVAPCSDHPLGKGLSAFADRLAWTRLAMRAYGDFVEVTDLERRLPGPSYTLRLLEAIAASRPHDRVRLIIGSDIVQRAETAQWHQWDRIEAEFDPLVVPRAGYAGPDACLLPEVSSTEIRTAVDEGRWAWVEDRVPKAVADAMRARGSRGPIWLVGGGNVAAHAEPWLRARGCDVVTIAGRDGEPPPGERPDGVWILVRDPSIAPVAQRLVGVLPAGVPVLHAAGALLAAVGLAPLSAAGHPVGTLHPICALRREQPWPPKLEDAVFGVEGDPPARALAEAMLHGQAFLDLGGLDATGRRAYHGACALAANHLAVLQAAATDVLIGQGHARATVDAALQVLLRTALENLLALGIPAGITGPVARGDAAAVQGHLAALDPETAALYRMLSERLEQLVRAPPGKPG